MASRRAASAETKFLRGETGVDGASEKEEADPQLVEATKSREALFRGRTWLGREALTWLLWQSEGGDPVATVDGKKVTVLFVDKLVLRSGAGDVTEVAVKGIQSPYSTIVRHAVRQGLLVHACRVQLVHDNQTFEVSLDAERFDLRAGQLPALLQEEDSEQLIERLDLVGRLGRIIDGLLRAFLDVRTAKAWRPKVVGELLEWTKETPAR